MRKPTFTAIDFSEIKLIIHERLKMSNSRKHAGDIFKQGVANAIQKANESGFVAAVRYTFLADMMQIQCLRAENTNLLNFTLPVSLYSSFQDLAAHNKLEFSAYETDSQECFALEFESVNDQDKIIQFFELMSFRKSRAYPTPDLFHGSPTIDKDFCLEILDWLHEVIQKQHANGWISIR